MDEGRKEKQVDEIEEEDLIKLAIIEDDIDEEPFEVEDLIELQTDFTFGIFQLLAAIADKMGIDTKELLGEDHPDFEEEE